MSKNTKSSFIPTAIYFSGVVLFYELFLKAFDVTCDFLELSLIPITAFSLAAGLLIAFGLTMIRPVKLSRILGGIIVFILWVFFTFEYDTNCFCKQYYSILFSMRQAKDVVNDFNDALFSCIIEHIPEELLLLVPFVVYILLRKTVIPEFSETKAARKKALFLLIPFVIFALTGSLYSRLGPDKASYTYEFSFDKAVSRIGLINSCRMELTYLAFGTPDAPLVTVSDTLWTPDNTDYTPVTSPDTKTPSINNQDQSLDSSTDEPEEPVVYGYNACVDFQSLIDNCSDSTISKMHSYFGSLEPSMQNEYTGYFEGKNLIFITAEAFSPYAVNEQYTPTLYKLANNGFVFENYYQPQWGLSTTGGEFANMTGLIPEWIGSGNSFTESASKYMPYSLANLLSPLGYECKAFHNNSYTFYDRHLTHPNLGYDYKGIGNGLKLNTQAWPNSDLEMMEATVDELIASSKETGKPFHTYYMTVSGHCNYNWGGNAMSARNKVSAQEAFPESSIQIQAYMAANKELDFAMEYLLNKLEEAGIAEDTVIVMCADHYPYAMSKGNIDYYNELSGIEDTPNDISRYQNTLIMYCQAMKEPIYVSTPCSSIDVVPTLCNLFGLSYDSRLYSGRDVFATNYSVTEASTCMPLVIIPVGNKYSFVTAAGEYNAITKEFTPYTNELISDTYISDVQSLITAKWTYAKLIITNDYYAKVFK